MSTPKLFQPITLGRMDLSHRVVLPPLTRMRTDDNSVPLPLVKEYYAQRASIPGTFLITEANCIAPKAGGFGHLPEIYTDEQVAAWKEVANAVHAKGSYIFLQLAALGRAASESHLKARDPSYDVVGPSAIPLSADSTMPRELTEAEIKEYIELYGIAAEKAVLQAGFDGVEIHGGNGSLMEQFIQDLANQRTDQYGGSIENRCRFPLEVTERISRSIGEDRVGFRITPWNKGQGFGMADPKPTYTHLVTELKAHFPKLAYLHAVEARVNQSGVDQDVPADRTLDFVREAWAPKRLIVAGGYVRENGIEAAEKGDLVAFGRWFIANPDLPKRLEKNIPLTKYNRPTFYIPGDASAVGLTDYPFAEDAPGSIAVSV
ncbi:FMN-linked oxidoreductase [Cylindrobasidium torrendii FP15055 ss-10]|uniref:FMN-linked oxidoreductase n=1 Tax=Cylindrobasidium torrendii FP15055 ss-10 TaxID=1314674 RepID=A0A0D7BVF2_9AGAR|nr:FMN-linked oxidoreductase [Cylindrobasidium torrendii FP15055 ss-10]